MILETSKKLTNVLKPFQEWFKISPRNILKIPTRLVSQVWDTLYTKRLGKQVSSIYLLKYYVLVKKNENWTVVKFLVKSFFVNVFICNLRIFQCF